MAARKNPLLPIPSNLAEVNTLLFRIGECERGLEKIKTDLEADLAKAKEMAELSAAPIEETLKRSIKALETYANANRKTLLVGEKKSVVLSGGEFGWRLPPTKVTLAKGGTEQVIQNLLAMKLKQYLRFTTEIDREALLRDRPAVSGVRYTQKEGFFVKPESSKAADSFPGIAGQKRS
jgi:phage host-nuclease inhibitor protein Gam